MSATTLSLFPSASVKSGSSGQKSALRYVSRSIKEPDFEMVKMSDGTHGIVIAVQETPAPKFSTSESTETVTVDQSCKHGAKSSTTLSNPPRAVNTQGSSKHARARTPSPVVIQDHIYPESDSDPVSSREVPLSESPTRIRAPSPLQHDGSPKARATSPTLVRKGSNVSTKTATYSPVMRSMFPRYDPNTSLARQRYYPHSQGNEDSPEAPRATYSPSLYSQQGRKARRLTLPVLDIPQSSSGPVPVLQQFSQAPTCSSASTPEQLLDIWGIANGQAASNIAEQHSLELSCESLLPREETIALSSTTQPFYSLKGSRGGVSISRTHPSSPQPTIQICETVLSTPSTTSPLVATIFPKLAELMAVDQSSSIAVSHRLDRQASAELQNEAVGRAQQNEASSLLWDSDSGKYFLIHPTLLDNASTNFPIEITPSASSPERIVISAPETDASTPLLTLALASRALTIHTTAITALPSLYTLDTLLSALFCLLLHLHRSSSTVAMPNTQRSDLIVPAFPPPPTIVSSSARSARRKKGSLSTWYKSNLASSSTHLHEQELDEEAGLGRQSSKDLESEWGYKPMIDADDESLPAPTRAVLRTIYWGFEVLIWMLGLFVNLIAAGVVGAGKIIKKL